MDDCERCKNRVCSGVGKPQPEYPFNCLEVESLFGVHLKEAMKEVKELLDEIRDKLRRHYEKLDSM